MLTPNWQGLDCRPEMAFICDRFRFGSGTQSSPFYKDPISFWVNEIVLH